MEDAKVTIWELYRVCQRIEAAVNAQNGRVRKLEDESVSAETYEGLEGRVRKLEDQSVRLKTYAGIGVVAGAFGMDWIKHKLGF